MKTRRYGKAIGCALLVAGAIGAGLAGCSISVGNGGISTSFTIGGKTITLSLGQAGLFRVTAGVPMTNIADSDGFLGGSPTDNPTTGTARLRSSNVTLRPPVDQKGTSTAQQVSGTVHLDWIIDVSGATDPCATGIVVGTFEIDIAADGTISVANGDLSLTPEAVALLLLDDISMCLRMDADLTATIEISGIDVVFGPGEDTGGGVDGGNGNANGNANGNGNDNGADPTCTTDADCATGEICTTGTCDPATPACVADADCATGETCTNGECAAAVPECAVDTDCASGEICSNGECVAAPPQCALDSDCLAGETCVAGDCVPAPEPEFTLAVINHVGSEQVLVGPRADEDSGFGFIPETGWGVTHLAMSGNGQNMWFITENEFSEVRIERQRLYFIRGDGTGLKRSAVPLDSVTDGFDIPLMWSLATDSDGLRAVMEARRNIQPPTPETAAVFYDLLAPGLPATVVFDTLGMPPAPPFGGRRRMQMSDDGNFVSWSDGITIWRYPMNILNSVADAEFTNAGFACGNFAGDEIGSFDRTAVDSRTLFGIRAVEGSEVCNTLILGSSQTDSANQNLTQNDFVINSVHITDDGLTMAYCLFSGIGSQADPAPCFVQGVNGPAAGFALTQTSDTWSKFTDIVLADSGIRYRVVVSPNVFSPNGISVFESPGRDDRKSTGTKMFGGVTQSISQVQLSFDGNEMAGLVPLSPSPKNNIYVLHDGNASLPGFPSIESVSYRYDAEADAFVFRVQVASDNGVNQVQVYPMKNGIDPGEYLPGEENPFADIRFGFGAVIAPVEGTTDLYEQTVPLFGLGGLIDDTYTLRIVVLDGPRARTVFADIAAPAVP